MKPDKTQLAVAKKLTQLVCKWSVQNKEYNPVERFHVVIRNSGGYPSYFVLFDYWFYGYDAVISPEWNKIKVYFPFHIIMRVMVYKHMTTELQTIKSITYRLTASLNKNTKKYKLVRQYIPKKYRV